MRSQLSNQHQNTIISLTSLDNTGYTINCDICSKSKAIADLDVSSNYGQSKKLCQYCLRILEKACRAIIRAAKEEK